MAAFWTPERVTLGLWPHHLIRRRTNLMDWIVPVLVIAAYIVLVRWVLPRLGVPT
jgi:hypothetical protein